MALAPAELWGLLLFDPRVINEGIVCSSSRLIHLLLVLIISCCCCRLLLRSPWRLVVSLFPWLRLPAQPLLLLLLCCLFILCAPALHSHCPYILARWLGG